MTGVYTRSFDDQRTGVNAQETVLTAPAVAKRGIKLLYSLPIPNDARGAEAQVLCAPQVTLSNGQVHDLIVIATLANQILAYDHADGQLLWERQLGPPIDNTVQIDSFFNAEKKWINDHWGILSTPVIDPTTQTLYACSWASPDGSVARAQHYLSAISLVSGTLARPTLNLEGAVYDPGGGVPVQKFASASRKQRASLLLLGQTVFVGFGSIYESAASNRGWVLAVDTVKWQTTAAWCTAVNGSGGGIWQAGAGLAADANGDIIVMTGNGDFDGKTEWGECFIKLRYTPPGPALMGELKAVDWWSPFLDSARVAPAPSAPATRAGFLSPTNTRRYTRVSADETDAATGNVPLNFGQADDMDLGSGGPVVIDELGLVLGAGKDGILYAVRLDKMGGTTLQQLQTAAGIEANYRQLACHPLWFTFYTPDVSPMPDDIRVLNFLFYSRTHHQHGSPIVWESPQGWRLYCFGENAPLRAWKIETLAGSPPSMPHVKISYIATGEDYASSQAPTPPGGMPGGMMCLSYDSANPEETSVLWALVPYGDANRTVTRGRLIVYDMTQLKEGPQGAVIPVIWRSDDWNHDFVFNKFCVPVVWQGKLYVPTFDAQILVFGLA